MKTFALTTALIASLAAPALAGASQLEKDLGVEPGVYSAAQLVRLKAAAEQTGNEARVHFGEKTAVQVSTSNLGAATADIVAGITEANDDGGWFRNGGDRHIVIGDGAHVDRGEGPNS